MIEPVKIEMKDAFKTFTLDQDKILSPQQTVERFRARLNTIDLDILAETVRIDNGRLDIPVYFSRCGRDARNTIGTKKQMGKGATPQQSEASAVMELAERFSFFSFCQDASRFFTDTYHNVKEQALPFEMIAQSVHDETGDPEISEAIFSQLPLRWTTAFNLTQGKPVLIPFNWFYTINEFNGPCAGNCVEEALSQGICEIVERHVSSLVSQNKIQVPLLSVQSVTDAMVRDMLGKYERAGINLYISDFTLDMGIPSVGVLAYDPTTFPAQSEIVWTAGTTPNPQKALSRALTEVAQLAGDFNQGANYVASGLPKFRRIEDAAYIMDPGSQRDITELPDLSDDNIKTEVENCIAALANRGLEVLVVDVKHARLDIPAYYTIIPGAHFRERARGTSVGMFASKLITETYPPQEALAELANIERLLPGKYYLKFYSGLIHLNLEAPHTALSLFQQALDLDPTAEDIASIYSYMGVCQKEMGQYEQALETLHQGLQHDNERTDIFNLMGFCHFKLKQHHEAIENFQRVIELNPSSAIDYANVASNYRDMGDKANAIKYYQIALALDPTITFAEDNLKKLLGIV
jgi:ribosomal protein S12 methylthiotransferase accessory factor